MEKLVILLCSMSGALVGAALGILVMLPMFRQPSAGEAELAKLKDELQSTEASLSARTSDLESLNKQLEEKDQTIQQNEATLKEAQRQLDIAVALRVASAERARELSVKAEALANERTQLEAKMKEERDREAEIANQQVASYDARLDVDKQQLNELTGQVARLTAEATEFRDRCEREKLDRSSAEAQLDAERERVQELTIRVQQLQRERSVADLKLEEERLTTAKGMKLLLMAQENFARVVKSPGADGPNGNNGHGLIEADGTTVEAPDEEVQVLQLAMASD